MTIRLTSNAFANNERIPEEHVANGDNASPPLQWSGVPKGTKELALIVDDPDAPSEEPFVHWVLFGIGPKVGRLPAAVDRRRQPSLDQVRGQGENSLGNIGYDGPKPPRGHGLHHYRFRLYALDQRLSGLDAPDKETLLAAMDGHVLDSGELVGTFERAA